MANSKQVQAPQRKRHLSYTKNDVESVTYREQIHTLERQSKIAAWNDYISFVVSKVLGAVGLIVGGLEALDPTLLPINLHKPEIIAGVGLALLTGKSIITLIAKIEKTRGGK